MLTNGWIDPAKRLPVDGQAVLVAGRISARSERRIAIAARVDGGWWRIECYRRLRVVEAWQYLPSLPYSPDASEVES